ncbi:hypothetical protein UlMin_004948 [Ulmus minor]
MLRKFFKKIYPEILRLLSKVLNINVTNVGAYRETTLCSRKGLGNWTSAMNTEFEALQRNSTCELIDLPAGANVTYCDNSLHLCQTRYIADLLEMNDMIDCKLAKTPGTIGKNLSKYDGELFEDETKYRSVVGALQYVTLTRPDIAFAVKKACQFMHSPTSAHWLSVKIILRYLRGTMQQGLRLNSSQDLHMQAYTDADYALTPNDRKSSSGYCVFFEDNLVCWSATKQKVVSCSSAESKYRGLAIVVAEIIWTLSLLQELCIPQHQAPLLWFDNICSSYLVANPVFHSRSKHIEIDINFVRD